MNKIYITSSYSLSLTFAKKILLNKLFLNLPLFYLSVEDYENVYTKFRLQKANYLLM